MQKSTVRTMADFNMERGSTAQFACDCAVRGDRPGDAAGEPSGLQGTRGLGQALGIGYRVRADLKSPAESCLRPTCPPQLLRPPSLAMDDRGFAGNKADFGRMGSGEIMTLAAELAPK